MCLDINSFKILTETDLKYLFPIPPTSNLGYKVQFRDNLKNWRRSQNIDPGFFEISDLKDWLTKFAEEYKTEPTSSATALSSIESSPTCSTTSSPIPPYCFSEHIQQSFNLDEYLKSHSGKAVWNGYINNNNLLPFLMRNKLINDIVQRYVDGKEFMHRPDFETITESICSTFQHERKETYFSVNGTHNAGRLYNAYKNRASRLRKLNLFPREKTPGIKRKFEVPEESTNDSLVSLNTEDPNQVWLQVYSDEWEEIIVRWKETCVLRQEQIQQAGRNIEAILKAWPRYSHSRGGQLVDIDFEYMFPNKGHLLLSKWDEFKSKIIIIFQQRIKDKPNLDVLNELVDQYRNNPKNPHLDISIFKLLQTLLVPTGSTKNKTTQKIWKFSILDGQEAFIKIVKSFSDIQQDIAGINETYLENGITFQPTVFIVNDNEANPIYYTIYDNIFYKFSDLTKAITTSFKLHYVFGLKYQIQCKLIWEFIQQYFFEINVESSSTTLSTLLSSLL